MDDSSFTPQVFVLAKQLRAATTKEEREQLMLDLAEAASQTYDPTDAGNCDDYHIFFEEYLEAEKRLRLAAFRLGRLVAQSCDTIEGLEPLTPRPSDAN